MHVGWLVNGKYKPWNGYLGTNGATSIRHLRVYKLLMQTTMYRSNPARLPHTISMFGRKTYREGSRLGDKGRMGG